MFRNKTVPPVDDSSADCARLNAETAERLKDDKEFWSDVIKWIDAENETEAARAIRVADLMLEARRERFSQ